jgi:F-type H+-transporting ATPase subunit epsilon
MAETIHLQIATPDRLLVDDEVAEVQVPGENGYLGILPLHAPLLSELGSGELYYVTAKGVKRTLAVSGGWLEVLPDKVRILATVAEKADDIDTDRAEKALQRATQRLSSTDATVDIARALNAMKRAQARLSAAKYKEAPAKH